MLAHDHTLENNDGLIPSSFEKWGKEARVIRDVSEEFNMKKTQPQHSLKDDERDMGIRINNQEDETFDTTFNKEVELDLNEVPTVLFELHENSLLYMDREEWDRAL